MGNAAQALEPTEPTQTPQENEEPKSPDDAEAETPEPEDKPEEGTEGEEPPEEAKGEGSDDEENEEGQPQGQNGKKKRQGGWQRRIDRLERQNAQLVEALTLRGGGPPPTEKPDKEKTAADKAEEWVRNVATQQWQELEQQRQQQTTVAEFQRRTREYAAKTPDFDDAVAGLNIHPASAIGQALLTSERPGEILHLFAKDPAVLARVSALPATDAFREIGRLEAKVTSSTPPPKATPRRSSAPAPITPVTARGPSAIKRPEDMTYEEYSAWREGQRKR